MKATALLIVFLLCKLLVLAGRHIDFTPFALAAYIWQDCLVVLLFAGVEHIVGKKISWALYTAAVLWAAINVPVTRMMSTPLTWPMLHAAGGPLLDSTKHQPALQNLASILVTATTAVSAPILLQRFR